MNDLPRGDWRRVAKAKDVDWIVVNGEIIVKGHECTSATPGEFLGLVSDNMLEAAVWQVAPIDETGGLIATEDGRR